VLNEGGRLNPKTHDETFINQLRKSLLIPDGEDVATFLSRGTTDTTTLLVAILTSLEPFGWMLRDIYDLFVRHGVNESDEQLLIEFDFGDSRKKLTFDLSSFLAGVETLEKLSQSIEVHAFTYLDLRNITKNVFKALVEVCDPSQVGQAEVIASDRTILLSNGLALLDVTATTPLGGWRTIAAFSIPHPYRCTSPMHNFRDVCKRQCIVACRRRQWKKVGPGKPCSGTHGNKQDRHVFLSPFAQHFFQELKTLMGHRPLPRTVHPTLFKSNPSLRRTGPATPGQRNSPPCLSWWDARPWPRAGR
jgi:hypothetical protein